MLLRVGQAWQAEAVYQAVCSELSSLAVHCLLPPLPPLPHAFRLLPLTLPASMSSILPGTCWPHPPSCIREQGSHGTAPLNMWAVLSALPWWRHAAGAAGVHRHHLQ